MRIPFKALVLLITATGSALTGEQGKSRSPGTDWPMFNRDLAGTRYSPLTQINTTNVANLKVAWTYKLRPHDGKPLTGQSPSEMFQEVTPIVVNGVMYLPAANRVVALEPETGKEIWSYELKDGQASFRGVSYWPGDKNNPSRILFTTARKLVAVNAVTGEPSTGFGNTENNTLPSSPPPTAHAVRITNRWLRSICRDSREAARDGSQGVRARE